MKKTVASSKKENSNKEVASSNNLNSVMSMSSNKTTEW